MSKETIISIDALSVSTFVLVFDIAVSVAKMVL